MGLIVIRAHSSRNQPRSLDQTVQERSGYHNIEYCIMAPQPFVPVIMICLLQLQLSRRLPWTCNWAVIPYSTGMPRAMSKTTYCVCLTPNKSSMPLALILGMVKAKGFDNPCFPAGSSWVACQVANRSGDISMLENSACSVAHYMM
jgi:hypothetical protein